jgi:uncharacterized paraquat-inducible protein A
MGGGVMMLGIGSLMMLLVFGLPVLLIGAVVVGLAALLKRPATPMASAPVQGAPTSAPAASSARYCSHCGQGLQAEWTHCPRCGAPAQAK